MLDMNGTLSSYSNIRVENGISDFFKYVNLKDRNRVLRFIQNHYYLTKSKMWGLWGEIFECLPLCDLGDIYIFNDSFHEVQVLLEHLSNKKVWYIEDGSAPYNEHQVTHRHPNWLLKLILGYDYQSVNVLGTSHYVDECLFTNPELARPEHKAWPITKFSFQGIEKHNLDKFFDLYDLTKIENQVNGKEASLYLMPSCFDRETNIKYNNLMEEFGGISLIKQHPMTKDNTEFPVNSFDIDPSIPAEVLILKMKNIKVLVGYPSTTLFVAKILRPDLEVYGVLSLGAKEVGATKRNLESVGVKFLKGFF